MAAVFQLLALLTGTGGLILAFVSTRAFGAFTQPTSDDFVGGVLAAAMAIACFTLCFLTTMMSIGASH